MAGTMIGGKKAVLTTRRKYDEEYLEKYGLTFYQYQGRIGGQKGRTGGFFANRELAREAGRKGGKVSKRGKKVVAV